MWLAGCDEAIALFFLAVIVGHGDLAFLGGLRVLCRGFCFCEMAHCIVSGFKAANRERGEQNPSPWRVSFCDSKTQCITRLDDPDPRKPGIEDDMGAYGSYRHHQPLAMGEQ
jgi:hypothetical protein